MPTIRIRIGASVEADFGALIFRPLVEQAKAARAAVRREIDGIGTDLGKAGGRRRGGAGAAGAEGGGGYRENAPGGDGELQRRRRTNRDIESEEERHQREMNRKQREEERLAERKQEREQNRRLRASERRVERISGSTVSGFGGVVRRGAGVASDLARGAGIDFGLGNALQQRFSLEKSAIDLSNASFMPGDKGAAGQRQDPRALMADVQNAANTAALDVNTAMEGLQAFVGKTGDLATGRAVLKDMAILARATGGELNDIVSAAGDVAANLGEVGAKFKTPEEKARAVASVMAAMAAQGKVGAVEMKDLASQMAKLAASAPQFAGPIEQSMATMGALAQMARAKGGASSATQATTSVQGFVATFGKAARRKELKAAGVEIEDKAGMLLDPEEIIVNALKATKGSTAGMNKLFMDAGAQRVTRGFKNIYNQAEAEKKGSGEAAVRAEFSKLKKASMSDKERDESFQTSMKGGEAQAQVLKNQVEKQLGDAMERVAPKLMELAPRVGQVTEALGGLVAWAASNPMGAVGAALAAGLAKSMGEQLATGVAKSVTGALAGNLTLSGFTVASMAIASVGLMGIEYVAEKMDEESRKKFKEEGDALNKQVELRRTKQLAEEEKKRTGAVSPETAARLGKAQQGVDERRETLEKRIAEGEKVGQQGGIASRSWKMLKNMPEMTVNSLQSYMRLDSEYRVGEGKTFEGAKTEARNAEELGSMKAELAGLKAAMDTVNQTLAGGLVIKSMPTPPPGPPAVNPAGRTP